LRKRLWLLRKKRKLIVSKTAAEKFLRKKLKSLGDKNKRLKGKRSYYVLSSDGSKNLGGPYSLEDAKKRLRAVEYFKRNPSKPKAKPDNPLLYAEVKAQAREKFDVYPSIYANSWVVKEYKRRGGTYSGVGTGLTEWYAEKWVDLARSTDSEGKVVKWVECGRPKAGKRAYPKCVPLAKAKAMSPSQRLSAIRRKRKVERKAPVRGKKGEARTPEFVKTFKDKKKTKKQKSIDARIEAYRKKVRTAKIAAAAARRNPDPMPSKFSQRPHDWSEILIQRGNKKLSRRDILNYYKKAEKNIWPFLKNQTVMVIFAPKKNVFVRRRNDPEGRYIKLTKLKGIDDPRSFEYWICRRTIEFHPVLTKQVTPIAWLDIDVHQKASPKELRRLDKHIKKNLPKIKKVMRDTLGMRTLYVYESGSDLGYHIEGNLPKKMKAEKLRIKLRKALDEAFKDDLVFTTGIAKKGQVRLDTSTLHILGSLRAPYSMTIYGKPKKKV